MQKRTESRKNESVKKLLVLWGERYLYAPSFSQKLLSYLLLPLSALYCVVVYVKYIFSKPQEMNIAVISVGNLTVGGSGKTPLVSALAQRFENSAVVLRGYGRKTKGLIVVSDKGEVFGDVMRCGDEAMVYAKKLPKSTVIVAEDRKEGIAKAKELGASCVFLDDGYSKHDIKKLDILIEVLTPNRFCLPSGAYRERLWSGKEALVVKEGKEFVRKTKIVDEKPKMALVTSIARPQRLDKYLPDVVSKHYFEDHHDFTKEEIEQIFQTDKPDSLLVTLKDYVKLERFGFPLSLLDLELEVDERFVELVKEYLKVYNSTKT